MLRSFFLFWPSNVMPIWLLLTLMQLKIPLITFMRFCCIEEVRHYWAHWLSALVILSGCVVHMLRLQEQDFMNSENKNYAYYLILSVILDVISHTVKEAHVRAQPINQEKYNFQIGLFQLFAGLLLFPLVKITQATVSERSPFFGDDYAKLGVFEYAGVYIKYGMMCVLDISPDGLDPRFSNYGECHNSWAAILGYTVSLFLI